MMFLSALVKQTKGSDKVSDPFNCATTTRVPSRGVSTESLHERSSLEKFSPTANLPPRFSFVFRGLLECEANLRNTKMNKSSSPFEVCAVNKKAGGREAIVNPREKWTFAFS